MLLYQIIGGPGIIDILEVVYEAGKPQTDIFLQQPLAYTLGLSRTCSAINQEIGIVIIKFQVVFDIPDCTGSLIGLLFSPGLFGLPRSHSHDRTNMTREAHAG